MTAGEVRDTNRKTGTSGQDNEQAISSSTVNSTGFPPEPAKRLELLERVVGGIAHELKNPLAVIDSSAFYLSGRLPEDAQVKRHLERIHSGIQDATGIIESLLMLSGHFAPRWERLDLKKSVSLALDSAPLPETIQINIRFAEGEIPVHADPRQLDIAIRNVIKNAGQAMGTQGTLSITSSVEGNVVILCFRDTGPGIRQEDMPRIFEPWYTTRTEGTGLGLPLAKMIVEAHGGDIMVASPPGQGTSVFIGLPLML